jgi:hypothetical protein
MSPFSLLAIDAEFDCAFTETLASSKESIITPSTDTSKHTNE